MCGIFGYTGENNATPILLQGLKSLEYRGYDSAGVALESGGEIQIRKARGRIAQLEALLQKQPAAGQCGIAHTRWATHGGPSDVNAHPHADQTGRFAVVHNGVIENHEELRAWLQSEGVIFASDTDTEVISQLIGKCYRDDFPSAVLEAVHYLKGAYALAVLCREEPGKILCIRTASPLVIGLSGEGQYLASDMRALVPYTRTMIDLKENELAELTAEGCRCFDRYGREKPCEIQEIQGEIQAAEMGEFPHFMLKEIFEQPEAMDRVVKAYTGVENGRLEFQQEFPLNGWPKTEIRRICLVGCGSAYHAACLGKMDIEALAGIPARAELASEWRYQEGVLEEETLYVLISQSGETADTLAAMRRMKANGAPTLAVVNVEGSTLARESERVLYTHAGEEIAVATTKGYMTQAVALYLLALYLACRKGKMKRSQMEEEIENLLLLPEMARRELESVEPIQETAQRYAQRQSVFYIGRGRDWALAREASLKLKEISYTHSEAYAAGELKHGTIALIEPGGLVVALATQEKTLDKMLSNLQEVSARGGEILAVTQERFAARVGKCAQTVWTVPDAGPAAAALAAMIPLQLFAYYTALELGCDVDKPRNLAKSVTVE